MKIILTRPYNDSVSLKKRIEKETDHKCVISPLLEIEYLEREINIPKNFNIIFTSSNGVVAFANLTDERDHNVITVGATSKKVAEDLGFKNISSATHNRSKISGEVALVNFIKSNYNPSEKFNAKHFIHISAEVTKGNLEKLLLKNGFSYQKEILYKAHKKSLSQEVLKLINSGEKIIILFFSERTAKIFVRQMLEMEENSFAGFSNIIAVCFSRNIADAISDMDFAEVTYPKFVNTESVITLLKKYDGRKQK